jgi:hypothetical protein
VTLEEAYEKYENGMYITFKRISDNVIVSVEREV